MIENRLSTLMGARRMGVTDLARATGLAYSTCWQLYADKTKQIRFDTLDTLCRYFGVSVCEILEYKPDAEGEMSAPAVEGQQVKRVA
jgi:putative transcriptional regulator